MKYKIDVQHLLPVNIIGSENNAVSFFDCSSETEAFERFRKFSQKLLDVNGWNQFAGKNPTEFYLHGKENKEGTAVQLNDLVKIKMPAPKNKLGNGFDWVMVNKIEVIDQTEEKVFLLQMRPHSCAESGSGSIAHFYTEDASNTFILSKKNKVIQFSIHGRNELANTSKVGWIHSLRNFFVASGGIFGGSKVQWQDFTEEFLKN